MGEGVRWIRSRRVCEQCSGGSRAFQLSPAFFSRLPDGSQMFFLAAALSASTPFLSFPSSASLFFHISCPPPLPVFPVFFLFRDHTLLKSAHFTLSDRNRPSSNKQSFSTLVLFISPLLLPPLPLPSSASSSLSSFIAHHSAALGFLPYHTGRCRVFAAPNNHH